MKKLKNKKASSKTILNTQILVLTTFTILIMSIVAAIALYVQQNRINDLKDKMTLVSSVSNQACLGLGDSKWQTNYLNSFTLDAKQTFVENSSGSPRLVTVCKIGGNTKAVTVGANVAQVDKDGLDFGAQVIYFKTAKAASQYGDKVINPQRYWTVPNGSLTADLPMWHYFYSYVFDGHFPYFDAYAVKGNAVMRVTLPCGDKRNPNLIVKSCSATDTLKSFSQAIANLQI